MIERSLRRLATLASRRYGIALGATLIVVLAALVPALRLRFDTGTLSLLPGDDSAVRTFRDTLERFGSLEMLLVVVRIPEGVPLAPYLDLIDTLGPRLEQLEQVDSVEYSLGELEGHLATLLPRAFVLFDRPTRAAALERLSDQGIDRRVEELRRQVMTPRSLLTRPLAEIDPLGLSELLLTQLATRRGGLSANWTGGYLLSQDNRMALVIVRPVRPAMEADFAGDLLAAVEGASTAALAEWPAIAGPDGSAPPEIDLGGTYVTVVEDARGITRDVVNSVGTAMIGVLVLFVVTFRRLGIVGYAFIPLSVGIVLALGFAGAVFGELSAASSGFAALLIGLALDFVIVSYGRYVEERRAGAGLEEALVAMAGTSGRAVVTGAVTTAATFFALGVTGFPGLRELGLLSGTGILLLALAVLVLLPALLGWREQHPGDPKRPAAQLRLHAFGIGSLVTFSFRRPVLVLTVSALISLAATAAMPRLRFENDFRQLRPAGSRGVAVQKEVAGRFGADFGSTLIMVEGGNEEELLARVHRAAAKADDLVDRGVLRNHDSLAVLLPSFDEQRAALDWIRQNAALLDGPRLRSRFCAAAEREGLRAAAFERGLALLEEATAATAVTGIGDLEENPRIARMLRRYVNRDGDRLTTLVYLESGPGDGRGYEELAQAVAELGPGFELTGVEYLGEGLRKRIRGDAVIASLVGFAIVALLLFLEYRRIDDVLLSLLPLVIGMLWMLGSMVALGLPLNFFSIFVTTMIIGIGVDYGIHMVHRYREHAGQPPREMEGFLHETGRAVVLAALSTVVGFGSLVLSHYPAVRSLGLVATLGALSTSLVAITALPAVLALCGRRLAGGLRPDDA